MQLNLRGYESLMTAATLDPEVRQTPAPLIHSWSLMSKVTMTRVDSGEVKIRILVTTASKWTCMKRLSGPFERGISVLTDINDEFRDCEGSST